LSDITIYLEAVKEIKNAILQSRYRAAQMANAEQLSLYYSVGKYVSENTRTGQWGTRAIEQISKQLQVELPGLRGFSPTNIKYMRLFYEKWQPSFEPNRQLPSDDLSPHMGNLAIRQLSTDELASKDMDAFLRVGFSHHTEILSKCDSLNERWYYIHNCAVEFWTVESLKYHIRAKDFEKYGTAPNNFELTIPDEKQVSRAVLSFKDEYLLDYINIDEETDPELIDERVLNKTLVANIKNFILAFGDGFIPMGSQFRIIVEGQEFFLDLLFHNRNLNCLVDIELKRGVFKPSYLGQLNFYLSALDDYVKKPHENNSIGLLLCKEANRSIVELAVRDFNKPMGVATYRLGKDIPEEYRSLIPIIDGVQKIISESEIEE
jgi:predicted nuclease of restriction endonuclease-like (RecB) superfamily